MKFSTRVQAGDMIHPRDLMTIHSERIRIPDRRRWVHLQFRRFAGCPVCNLHLRSIARRRQELEAASILEVVVFHSTREELTRYARELPLAIIADPGKRLYSEFGVESAPRALLDPRAWFPIVQGVFHSLRAIVRKRQPIPPLNPAGGRFGLPADFLIARDGRVVARKYGSYVDDQWSVDEILSLSRSPDAAPHETAQDRQVATHIESMEATHESSQP